MGEVLFAVYMSISFGVCFGFTLAYIKDLREMPFIIHSSVIVVSLSWPLFLMMFLFYGTKGLVKSIKDALN